MSSPRIVLGSLRTYEFKKCVCTVENYNNWQFFRRFKSKRNVQSDETTTQTEGAVEAVADKHSKLVSANLNSLRVDGIVKAGLGMARNKVEKLFYESKIRLNEEKVLKKSVVVQEGDEVDVIKGAYPMNPDLMTVARVEVVEIKPSSDHYKVTLKRSKSLLIENYDKTRRET